MGSQTLVSSRVEGVQVRKVNFGRLAKGVLHSKIWIVDRKHLFIGSANMDWRALTQVTPNICCRRQTTDSLISAFAVQVKELGVVIYNCSSLGKDLRKIFQSYWVMGQPNSSLPHRWPAEFDTAINKHRPLVVKTGNVSSRIYLTVSSYEFLFFRRIKSCSLCSLTRGCAVCMMQLKLTNHMVGRVVGFCHQASPPSFCPTSRTQDLEAILSIISEAQHFVHVAVMEYFPTTRFEKPQR